MFGDHVVHAFQNVFPFNVVRPDNTDRFFESEPAEVAHFALLKIGDGFRRTEHDVILVFVSFVV